MQWTDGAQAGFTAGTPWIGVNPNHAQINVAADRADPDGVFAHYRGLIALRRDMPLVQHGRYIPHAPDHSHVWAYERRLGEERLVVVASFADHPVAFDPPAALHVTGTSLSANVTARTSLDGPVTLAPFEAFAIHASPGGAQGA
nr:DUF3459 domain-containing protein [Pseudaestuariivita atlantica]